MSLFGRPRSVRARLTLTATVGAAVVLSVGAGLMYLVLTSRLDQALSDELAVRAGDVEAELSVGAVVSLGGPLCRPRSWTCRPRWSSFPVVRSRCSHRRMLRLLSGLVATWSSRSPGSVSCPVWSSMTGE